MRVKCTNGVVATDGELFSLEDTGYSYNKYHTLSFEVNEGASLLDVEIVDGHRLNLFYVGNDNRPLRTLAMQLLEANDQLMAGFEFFKTLEWNKRTFFLFVEET